MHHRFLGPSVQYITFTFVPFRWLYVVAAKQRRQFVRGNRRIRSETFDWQWA